MYVEAQVGNQCRRHALNAFMGGPIVQWGDIEGYAREFEAALRPSRHGRDGQGL